MTDEAIAADCGVTRQALAKWKVDLEFSQRVAEIVERSSQALEVEGLANKQYRIALLNMEKDKILQVIAERAADPTMAKVPGGTTGIMVRRFKQIGTGKEATMVEEYEVDNATLSELRGAGKQAAQEAGQWTEKRENRLTDKAGDDLDLRTLLATPVQVEIVGGVNPFDQ